tara:strand:+ start:39 stop:395 length:357 start_codon:yes stop_codon:yes gene_type:complete
MSWADGLFYFIHTKKMSIKVAILNDGTQLLADIKEVTDGETKQFLVIKPFEIVYQSEMTLMEDNQATKSEVKKVGLKTWLEISSDDTFILNPNTVTTVCDPVSDLTAMYEDLTNGRRI